MIDEKVKILLCEDDENLGMILREYLQSKGYDVDLLPDGEAGYKAFTHKKYDLCILDVMMPKKDGFTVAQQIRKINPQIPILFVTAKSMLEDKIAGFESGGDDYIVKPFSMEELVLRIEVFLRRSNTQPIEQHYSLGAFTFDCRNYTLYHSAGEKSLTQKEAEVLKLLCENRNLVLKREEILKKVWGSDDYFMGRSMDVFISKLRKYLKDDPSIQIINYHGVGFKLEVAPLQ